MGTEGLHCNASASMGLGTVSHSLAQACHVALGKQGLYQTKLPYNERKMNFWKDMYQLD
jgi:hypothetical protein